MNQRPVRSIEEEGEELPEYRPLSFPAIAAILLSLPGLLGVFHPAFLIFPLIAITLSAIALRQIATSSAAVSGRGPALVALVLSLFLIGMTVTVHVFNSRREYLYALSCTENWLRMLRGEDPREAYLLTLAFNMRPLNSGEGVPVEIRQANHTFVPESGESFENQAAIKALADPANRVQFLKLVQRDTNKLRGTYQFLYDVYSPAATPPENYALIEAQRFLGPDGVNYWQIGSWQLAPKPPGQPIQ